ncbi:unnamed protein product, partial [Colletotrichum noveboracense]
MLNASISHRKTPGKDTAPTQTDTPFSNDITKTTIRQANTTTKNPRLQLPSPQWWLLAIPSFLISLHGALFFTGLTPGDPQIKARILASTGGCVHIFGSFIAMGLGPF